MTRFLLFTAFTAAGVAQAAGPTIEVTAQETCREHIASEPRLTANDWPERARGLEVNAYVVITYRLDGSGKAKDLVVTDAKPNNLFNKTTLSILERTEFKPGAEVASCTYVRTYGAARRAER
ncbi:energy transducer TonB [Luteimonas sp. RIT-PG2_3]